jgi:hypothetical protein
MDAAELALWHEQAQRVRLWSMTNTDDPCFDCTPLFAVEMRALGRCNGIPGVARPVAPIRSITERRRDTNLRAQRKWRASHRDEIRARRRAYFAERYLRKRDGVDTGQRESA